MRVISVFTIIALAAGLFLVNLALAGDLDVSGDIRWRSEVDGTDFNKDTKTFCSSVLRTRLYLDFEAAENVKVFVQAQDSRNIGWPASGNIALSRFLGFNQVYLKAWDLFTPGLGFMAGRFALSYGNERVFGTVGWSNTGRYFEGS